MKIIIEKHLEPHIVDFINEMHHANGNKKPLSYFHDEVVLTTNTDNIDLVPLYKYFEETIKVYNGVLSGKLKCSETELALIKKVDRKYKINKILNENSN